MPCGGSRGASYEGFDSSEHSMLMIFTLPSSPLVAMWKVFPFLSGHGQYRVGQKGAGIKRDWPQHKHKQREQSLTPTNQIINQGSVVDLIGRYSTSHQYRRYWGEHGRSNLLSETGLEMLSNPTLKRRQELLGDPTWENVYYIPSCSSFALAIFSV